MKYLSIEQLIVLPLIALVSSGAGGDMRIDPLLRDPGEATVAAVVRLPTLDAGRKAALEADGIRFRSSLDGAPRHLGALYPVDASEATLARWARRGIEVRVSRPIAMGPTLYQTAFETEAADLRGYGPTPTQGALGQRIVVGAFDSGINIFHPHFFRADGGAWPWVDADGDGTFTPGVDAVDANLDGEIDPGERLQLLDYGFHVGNNTHGFVQTFEPAFDYLYLDLNESGDREFGTTGGFSEDSPGYGEAMFLPDDANGDGVLGLEERVILLGTSQVAGLRSSAGTWTRGEDLITAPALNTWDIAAAHGTSAMGIITGGQAHPFRANRGHIPDADIAMFAYGAEGFSGTNEAEMVAAMAWMTQDMEAAVVNHSWGVRGDRLHLDGSNVIDAVIDEATSEGAIQVCAAGNRGDKAKHRATMTSNGAANFTASVPNTVFGATVRAITFDLHWPVADGSFSCTVERPDGATHDVQQVPDGNFDGLNVDAVRWDSDRMWAMLSIVISNTGSGHVGAGAWQFACTNDNPTDFLVHAQISDGISFAQEGAAFQESTATSTIVSPGSADGCITAAGYPLQYSQSGAVLGALEPYSSRGPRIDGPNAVDIAAPVDAVTPMNDPLHPNAYRAFSGTSGAAPQVSAIAGLMKALDPELSPEGIAQQIRDAGAVDAQVNAQEFPDAGWGYGRLRGYEAFTGQAPPPRPRVRAFELAVEYAYADGQCAATVSAEGAAWAEASFRWDDEYDGTWDTDFEAADSRTLLFTEDGQSFQVRVDGGERGFIVAGAILSDTVPASCFEPPEEGTGGETGTTTDAPPEDDFDTDGEGTTGEDTSPEAGDAGGCGCRHRKSPPAAPLAFVVLGLLLRRRRD